MRGLQKIQISPGIDRVDAPHVDLRALCGCPADSVKHLIKRNLSVTNQQHDVTFETGPNAILLSDVPAQNGSLANLATIAVEIIANGLRQPFPVLAD